MKATKAMLALAMVLTMSSGSAYAWGNHYRPHVRFGVVLAGPLWFGPAYYPRYYYPPHYYAPAYYPAMPASPPVYIEQGEAQPAAPPQAYWYYCTEAKGYHPYVKDCPGGWQRVAPQPPPG